MPRPRRRAAADRLAAAAALALLAGCHTFERIQDIGDYPKMTPITNPQTNANYKPLNMPMPSPQPLPDNPNSLWRTGARAFFKDIRAKDVGDPLTVRLKLNDIAKWRNDTARDRNSSESLGLEALMGYEQQLGKIFPRDVNNADLLGYSSKTKNAGGGEIDRSERMNLTFSSLVEQVLPNGSLVIRGQQEVRVNFELRQLVLTGIVRPQDIEADNSVSHERIAEMRLGYGGRGSLSDVQQPRWGAQVLDILLPF